MKHNYIRHSLLKCIYQVTQAVTNVHSFLFNTHRVNVKMHEFLSVGIRPKPSEKCGARPFPLPYGHKQNVLTRPFHPRDA